MRLSSSQSPSHLRTYADLRCHCEHLDGVVPEWFSDWQKVSLISTRILLDKLIMLIGTYYATSLGACGVTNTDSDYIVAVSHLLFDTHPYISLLAAIISIVAN